MTDCCNAPQPAIAGKHTCPVNGKAYNEVGVATVMHHINQPWNFPFSDQAYYFCEDPQCDVIYFARDNSTICKDALRTTVGIKEQDEDSLICYCFGVSRKQAKNNPLAKTFVMQQTKNHGCACTTRNPAGRCCLKDFHN